MLQEEPYDDFYEDEQDWATSDHALSNLEERLMRWHDSFAAHKPKPSLPKVGSVALTAVAPISNNVPVKGDRCVVKLHRFHCDVSLYFF